MNGIPNGRRGGGGRRSDPGFHGARDEGVRLIRLKSGMVSSLRFAFFRRVLTQRYGKPSACGDARGPLIQRQN